MANSDYILEMRDICKAFPGVQALDHAQLLLRPSCVHALMGENGAGKSTLMKCLFGIYQKDAGEIFLDGHPVNFNNPYEALQGGVSMVHQELNQVLEQNVMENIWLGRFPMKGIVVDERAMYRNTKEIFDNLHIDIDPKQKIGELSVSQRQMAEIAKAVSCGAKIIVLDEPTSSLTENEVSHLFRIVSDLRSRGCAIVYISHKMEEILQISDEVTIMRDGKSIATQPAAELTIDKIVSLMVGRDLSHRFPQKSRRCCEDILLEVRNIKGAYAPAVKDASFQLRQGEILGIAGLVGARRTELVETIFGLRTREQGEIYVEGKKVENRTPSQAIENGFALVTEERRQTGVFEDLPIIQNATVANLAKYTGRLGVLDNTAMVSDAKWVVENMKVKTPFLKTHMGSLSGGNQQKVILGRWLLTNSKILMLDEPTRGIDVVSKFEIYQLMIDLAQQGKGILFISSEMPELLGVTDRILVMSGGLVAGIVNTQETTQEEILSLAAKYL